MKMNIKRSSLIMKKKKKITTTTSFSVIKRGCASSRCVSLLVMCYLQSEKRGIQRHFFAFSRDFFCFLTFFALFWRVGSGSWRVLRGGGNISGEMSCHARETDE